MKTTPTTGGETMADLPVVAKTAPEKIFLVIGEDCPLDARWDQLAEVLWCEENIDGNGIEYTRADIAPAQAALEQARADSEMWHDRATEAQAERDAAREEVERLREALQLIANSAHENEDWLRAVALAALKSPTPGKEQT